MWPHSPKALCWWRSSPGAPIRLSLPNQPRAGLFISSGSSHLDFNEGKGVSSWTVILFTCFSAYLQSDQDVTFEACEPTSAEDPGCFGVVFESKPQSMREYGIWGVEALVEVCISRVRGSVMQTEPYLRGYNRLPRDLTPSNTPSLNSQLCLPVQPVIIILSRGMCSFGGSVITGGIMSEVMLCDRLSELLFLTPVAELQSEHAHAENRGKNLITVTYWARSSQPSFRFCMSRVCFFAVVCLVANGRLNLLILDLHLEKTWFGFLLLETHGKGAFNSVSTTTWCDHWATAQSASNEPHELGVEPVRWETVQKLLDAECAVGLCALHLTLPCWNQGPLWECCDEELMELWFLGHFLLSPLVLCHLVWSSLWLVPVARGRWLPSSCTHCFATVEPLQQINSQKTLS